MPPPGADASPLEEAAGDLLGREGAGLFDSGGIYSDEYLIDRPVESEETEGIYERQGPLTVGQPPVPVLDFTGSAGAEQPPADSMERKEEVHQPPPSPPPPPKEPEIPVAAAIREPSPPKSAASKPSPTLQTTEKSSCKGPWWDCKSIDPRVMDLIYWRDVKKSGVVFGVGVLVLLSLAIFSLISVLAYLGLILLALTLSFRTYKTVLATVQKNDQGNPFKPYLEQDLHLPQDRVHEQVDVLLKQAEEIARHLRRLFLVEDMLDTAKFGVLLWALTYVGAWFSGMALVILAFIAAFTVPKFYETYKDQIDNYYGIARTQVKNIYSRVEEKVPFLKKKSE